MGILRIENKLVVAMFCFAHTSAWAFSDPVLVPEKPIAAPTNTNSVNASQAQSNSVPPLAPFRGKSNTVQSAGSGTTIDSATADGSSLKAVSDQDKQADLYPSINKMEVITFGQAKPNLPIEERLNALEQAIFHANFNSQSLFDRTQKLKLTILGPSEPIQDESVDLTMPLAGAPLLSSPGKQVPMPEPELTFFELVAQKAENQMPVDIQELPKFALQLVNEARTQLNLLPLNADKIASSMAQDQVADLYKRKVVSHTNGHGANPDLRYTNLGGNGAVMESVVALKHGQVRDNKYTKALVAHVLKLLIDRQDDREALLSPDATGFGFALAVLPDQRRAIACVEVSTTHGAMDPIAVPISIGDKIEIRGSVEQPYKFAKVTLAWEGLSSEVPIASDETDEALPYFPPLDYAGYKHKAEHDYSTAMTALRMTALVGVIAGGMFIPPVALAAPLIMIAPGGNGELKPMSDIPLHGGIKMQGNNFSGKVPMSNANKPGIYYITVWATMGKDLRPIPISRRAFVLTEKVSVSNKDS